MTITFPYGYAIIHESGTVVADFDCEVDAEVSLDGGQPTLTVESVWIDFADLLTSEDPLCRLLGRNIADKVEADEVVIAAVLEAEGIAYRGDGGNDPDGRFVRTRS